MSVKGPGFVNEAMANAVHATPVTQLDWDDSLRRRLESWGLAIAATIEIPPESGYVANCCICDGGVTYGEGWFETEPELRPTIPMYDRKRTVLFPCLHTEDDIPGGSGPLFRVVLVDADKAKGPPDL